jgi:uncharacterized protein DUF4019
MKLCVRAGAFLLALLVSSFCVAQDSNLKAATEAAEQWLAIMDAGHYGQSWDQASSFFQSKISKANWEQAANQVRTPLGKVESRQFKAADFRTKLPGAPDGQFCVMQFRTKFAAGGDMIETITPMLDKNGEWRVSGYYIKPIE